MATIVAAAGGGNWTVGSTWVGGVAPTAADDAQIPATAGNITIDSGAVCRSADFATYTGTVTHNAGATLTIGDATAGLTNIALRMVAGMTYTLGNATTSAINFISTSATTQTVDFAGKTTGNVTYNAASNGSWQLTGTHNTGATATVTLTKGSLDTNGQTCSWGLFTTSNSNVRSLTLGSSAITITGSTATVWDVTSTTNLTISAASSTINTTGSTATFHGGASKAYGTLNMTGSGLATWSGTAASAVNFNRTGTAVKTDSLTITNDKTITGVWTLAGNSATNRLLVQSSTVGTAVTVTNSGATHTWSNVDLMDIALGTSFNASAITGNSGDCGGNTNITFTTAATQTWSGTSGGNWSTNAWSGRVPLPQDDVVINAAFSASQTVTAEMPRLGKSIDWTGATGSPTWSFVGLSLNVFGSVTMISGMTLSGTNSMTFRGRGSFTLTSAGKQYPTGVQFVAPTGTYTLQDAFASAAGNFTLSNGTFNANGFNVSALAVISNGTATRTLTMGSGTWSLTQTTATTIWNLGTTTNLTFSGASSTIVVAASSANSRTFAGGGLTYGTLSYILNGSTGALVVTGANTFATINYLDSTNARTLTLPASTTTTVTTTWNINGGAGRLITVNSSSAGTAATLSKSSGVVASDYLSLQDSAATGGATWYAGSHSTNVSGNSGWIFSDPPTVTTAVVMSATASMLVPVVSAEGLVSAPVMDSSVSMLAPALAVGNAIDIPIMVANASMLVPTVTGAVDAGGDGHRPPPWPPWGP